MRGTRDSPQNDHPGFRFIPAHAGNTSLRPGISACRSVHPRACGEHTSRIRSNSPRRGSSPRMRGTLDNSVLVAEDPRFIPAHAGNTQSAVRHISACPVHPRACGEHNLVKLFSRPSFGSSPRMRGTHPFEFPAVDHVRFIPAHAGNTGRGRICSAPLPVHPRACGEHVSCVPAFRR